jgi:HAD superfamily hydrolase (TIGR01509 family)
VICDLIIFDCDGILVDSEPIALRINANMLAELGWIMPDDEIVERFVGRSMKSNIATIEAHLHRPVPADWADRFRHAVSEAHDAELTAVAGISEALAEISQWDVEICVASSGQPARIRHSLQLCGLYDRFVGRIFSAAEVAHGKPAPDLFLHAAARLGVEPRRCVVVEDSQYGVVAARAAGMHAYAYAGGVTPAALLDGPDTTVFTDMRKLPEVLASPTGAIR